MATARRLLPGPGVLLLSQLICKGAQKLGTKYCSLLYFFEIDSASFTLVNEI